MEWLQSLLDSSTTPAVTAFLLGLLTALSPCPLATNIAAIGYIGKHIESRKGVFVQGLLYTLGRTIAYTLLGVVLIAILRSGASVFGIQKFIATYGELILPPALLLIGLFMLFGNRLNLPSFPSRGMFIHPPFLSIGICNPDKKESASCIWRCLYSQPADEDIR